MPSGISNEKHYEIRVADNSQELDLKKMWPDMFTNMRMIRTIGRMEGHKFDVGELKMNAFGLAIQRMRKQLQAGDTFNSTCKISLPRAIETSAEVQPIRTDDGTRALMSDQSRVRRERAHWRFSCLGN